MSGIAGRVRALLERDPVCKGAVSAATIREIAAIFDEIPVIEDRDVMAERQACLAVMAALLARLEVLAGPDGEPELAASHALAVEIARLTEAIATLRAGLHRAAPVG